MAGFNKFDSFVEALAEGKHDFSADQLVVALLAAADAPDGTEDVLADLSEISYANCSSRNIATAGSAQAAGVYKLSLTDLVLTASGDVGPFRYVVIYNAGAPSSELVGFYDYGEEITLQDGETFTIDFDDTEGLLQIT